MYSDEELVEVIKGGTIDFFSTYLSGSKKEIEKYIKTIVADLNRSSIIEAKAEYDSYRSGYASFVHVFCYKKDGSSSTVEKDSVRIKGIIIYICRHAPVACWGASSVSKHETGGSSGLLSHSILDILPEGEWEEFIDEVKIKLVRYNISLLDKRTASNQLPFKTKIPTVLDDGGYTIFDALFYWED